MVCNVTGQIRYSDGSNAANRIVEFRAAEMGIYPGGGGGILTEAVSVVTDGNGSIDVDLMPGRYFVTAVSNYGVDPIGRDIIIGGVAIVPDYLTADIEDILYDRPVSGTVAEYYGTGPGQIPIHHIPGNNRYIETFGNGRVSRSTNRGGAGAAFDLIGVSPESPTVSGDAFSFGSGQQLNLTFSQATNINTSHVIAAVYRETSGAEEMQAVIMAGASAARWWTYLGDTGSSWLLRVSSSYANLDYNSSLPNTLYPGWGIYEIRLHRGVMTAYINGNVIGNTTVTSAVDIGIDTLGTRGVSSYSARYIGEFAQVLCQIDGRPNDLEPAVIRVRNKLANKYGIDL